MEDGEFKALCVCVHCSIYIYCFVLFCSSIIQRIKTKPWICVMCYAVLQCNCVLLVLSSRQTWLHRHQYCQSIHDFFRSRHSSSKSNRQYYISHWKQYLSMSYYFHCLCTQSWRIHMKKINKKRVYLLFRCTLTKLYRFCMLEIAAGTMWL